MNNHPIQFLFCLLAFLGLSGCGKQNKFVAPPPPQVSVVAPVVKDTMVYIEVPARTEASLRVEIRARVKGVLKSIDPVFKPGHYVKEGQLLFAIEPAEYDAAVATANANVTQAEADLKQKVIEHDRKKKAFDTNKAVSEIEVLKAEADVEIANAKIDVQKAALLNADLNLSYTTIKAPMAGQTSRQEVDEGSLVGVSEPTLLTTVIQDNPIFVNFEINERIVLRFLSKRPSADKTSEVPDVKLRLTLSDGTVYPKEGHFNFIDNSVNSETGTMRVRAEFKNPDRVLAGGLFVRIGIPKKLEKVALVPRMAIQRDLGGSYVLVIGEGNTVSRRVVKPTEFTEGELKIIEPFNETDGSGLKADDQVIVSNLQRIRAGMTVSIKGAAPAKPAIKTDKSAKQN